MLKLKPAVKNPAVLGLTCFFAYAACYTGRNILSSMMPQMIENNIYGRDLLAAMGSAFLISYGIGQLVNGCIGNKISSKIMVFIGLFLTGTMAILFPMFHSHNMANILWAVCGFLCSMLWGPLSKLVGENTSPEVGRIILTLLTIASIAGTGVTYLLAILSSFRNSWKSGFVLAGILLITVSVLWLIASSYMDKNGITKRAAISVQPAISNKITGYLIKNGFIAMTAATMLNGVIRNAVSFWIPTFISERFGFSSAASAAISSILPFVNLGGTLLSVLIAKKLNNDEKKTMSLLFAFSTVMFAGMFVLDGRGIILNIAALFAASAAMTGACNMIFSFYILNFAHTGKISGITGFLDFSSYTSASVVSILFSSLITNFGWNFIVGIWAVTTLLGIVFTQLAKKQDSSKHQNTLDTETKEALS